MLSPSRHFLLPNYTNPIYIRQVAQVVLPPIQNFVGICKQITVSSLKHQNMVILCPLGDIQVNL
jgi:hypothetical protein